MDLEVMKFSKAKLSHFCSIAGNAAVNAFDSLQDDTRLFQSAATSNGWIQIDLGKDYNIHRAVLFDRRDTALDQFHSWEVRVGSAAAPGEKR